MGVIAGLVVSGAIWKSDELLGDVALLEEGCHWVSVLMIYNLVHFLFTLCFWTAVIIWTVGISFYHYTFHTQSHDFQDPCYDHP